MAPRAPTAADSVGEAIPKKIEPRTATMRARAERASWRRGRRALRDVHRDVRRLEGGRQVGLRNATAVT